MTLTQTERVIKAARSYRGVCAIDFMAPDVIDGGPPITRLAARLYDAERLGYSFECIGKRSKCKVFRLISEPDVERAVSTTPPVEGDSLARADGPLSAGGQTLFDPSQPHWRDAA